MNVVVLAMLSAGAVAWQDGLAAQWSDCEGSRPITHLYYGDATDDWYKLETGKGMHWGLYQSFAGTKNTSLVVTGGKFDIKVTSALGQMAHCSGDVKEGGTCRIPHTDNMINFYPIPFDRYGPTFNIKSGPYSEPKWDWDPSINIIPGSQSWKDLENITTIVNVMDQLGEQFLCVQLKVLWHDFCYEARRDCDEGMCEQQCCSHKYHHYCERTSPRYEKCFWECIDTEDPQVLQSYPTPADKTQIPHQNLITGPAEGTIVV